VGGIVVETTGCVTFVGVDAVGDAGAGVDEVVGAEVDLLVTPR
jgi:hypothetical protein